MTDAAVTGLDERIGSIESLLANRGRSSTPHPPGGEKIELGDLVGARSHSVSNRYAAPRIAAIVHDEMLDALEQYFEVVPLMPSCMVQTVDREKPQVIVIHRAAFHEGPWIGAEGSTGGAASHDLLRLKPWSRKHGVPVLFIENGANDEFYTPALREIGTEVFQTRETRSRVPEGAPRSMIFRLAAKFVVEKSDQSGVS